MSPGSPAADLGYRRHRLAIQYDGGHHLLPAQIFSDRRRDKAFESAGWNVLVLTKDDLADGFEGATAKINESSAPRTSARRLLQAFPAPSEGAILRYLHDVREDRASSDQT